MPLPTRPPLQRSRNLRLDPRLTQSQSNFLLYHLPAAASLDDATRLAKIASPTLRRWIKQPLFRRYFRRALFAISRHRDATLGLAAARAAERLAESIETREPLTAAQYRACIDLLRLARTRRSADAARALDPILPSDPVPGPEHARLLDRLAGKDGAE